jgi:hypothetical protein
VVLQRRNSSTRRGSIELYKPVFIQKHAKPGSSGKSLSGVCQVKSVLVEPEDNKLALEKAKTASHKANPTRKSSVELYRPIVVAQSNSNRGKKQQISGKQRAGGRIVGGAVGRIDGENSLLRRLRLRVSSRSVATRITLLCSCRAWRS